MDEVVMRLVLRRLALPSSRWCRRAVEAQWWAAALWRTALLVALALGVLAGGIAAGPLAYAAQLAQVSLAAPPVASSQAQPVEAAPNEMRPVKWSAAPGTICLVAAPANGPRMLTPAQIADPRQPGLTFDPQGYVSRCLAHALAVPQPRGGTPQVRGRVILVSIAQQW
ncbi:MAG: hypothetical protein ACHQ4H_18740, partial [Ktedonobacterales bacterium]